MTSITFFNWQNCNQPFFVWCEVRIWFVFLFDLPFNHYSLNKQLFLTYRNITALIYVSIHVGTGFWEHQSVKMVYISTFLCQYYTWLITIYNLHNYQGNIPPYIIPLHKTMLILLNQLLFHMTFRVILYSYTHTFFIVMALNYRLHLGEIISLWYWVIPSMNMVYFTFYLKVLYALQ